MIKKTSSEGVAAFMKGYKLLGGQVGTGIVKVFWGMSSQKRFILAKK